MGDGIESMSPGGGGGGGVHVTQTDACARPSDKYN
jgi:hypothetical protein